MKKIFLGSVLMLALVSCNQEVEEQNARLEEQNEELQKKNARMDSLINEFVADFTQIQENLAEIREKEERIEAAREGDLETSITSREEVINEIEAINELLAENRETIKNLNDKLDRYQNENSRLKRMAANLQDQVNTKDSQVVVLKQNLAAVNFEMEALNARLSDVREQSRQLADTIEEQRENLNTAWYAVGSYDNLEENNVIDKKGGFIGIGRTKALADDFNRDYFTKIDTRQVQSIPLDAEEDDINLITNHPSDSYKLNKTEEQVSSLEITDPEKFWASSKYLVILID